MFNTFPSNEISSKTLPRPSQKFNKNAIVFPRITGRLLFDQDVKNHETKPRNGTFSMLNGKFNTNEQKCQSSLTKDASDEQEAVDCFASTTSTSSSCSYKSIEPRCTRNDSRRSRVDEKECSSRKEIDESHLNVEIMKGKNGFGFTIAGRKTTKGKLILCVGWVNPEGPAFGLLKAGDQITKVNKATIAEMEHNEVVVELKSVPIESFATLEIRRFVPDGKSLSSSGKETIGSLDTNLRTCCSEKDYQPITKPFDRNSNTRQSKKSFIPPTVSSTSLKPSYRKNPRIIQNMMKFGEHGGGNRSAKALAETRMRSHSVHSPEKHLNLPQKPSRKQSEVATNKESSNNYPNYLKERSRSDDLLTGDSNSESRTRQVKRSVTVKRHSPERKMRSSSFNRSQIPPILPRFYQMGKQKQPTIPSHLKNRRSGDFQEGRMNFSTARGQQDWQSRYVEEILYRSSTSSHYQKSPRFPLFDLSRLLNISPNAPSYYPFVERNIGPDIGTYSSKNGHYFSNF